MEWKNRLLGIEKKKTDSGADDLIEAHELKEREIKQAGNLQGKHYTEFVELVKQLKREKRHGEAINLLVELVNAVEREAQIAGWGVAPWYYEQLAVIYRKEKRYIEEVEIIERYERRTEAHSAKPSRLAERLVKARELSKKQKA